MRWFILILGISLSYFLGVGFARSGEASPGGCDLDMYDKTYKAILVAALDAKTTNESEFQAVINEKNDTVEALRALCRNQRSRYERS